ncbi:MAG: cupin domain-containing protein [Burkholderiaceae bacterium]|nr:cupin domain-containing protein [Burkholderiaceae bacterium]
MPKLDQQAIPERQGTSYPAPFAEQPGQRLTKRLGDAGGLTQFGVNLRHLPPGTWSSQRHWHTHEDEFVYVISGEVVLVTDEGEQVMRSGDCAAFPANTPNGHHLINRSGTTAVVLDIGTKHPDDTCVYSDIDMVADPKAGFVHRDGSPYK